MPTDTPSIETNPNVLRDAILARLPHRSAGSGQVRWPAIPALLDHYTSTLLATFAGLGRAFDAAEQRELRERIAAQLEQGFAASPFSKLVVDYRTAAPPDTGLHYTVAHEVITLADEYDEWVQTRQPPLFGGHPDAKVLSLAHTLGAPHEVAVLDVGAGTGRNTLPLARAGFSVDAVELAPSLAAVLRSDLARENVDATVFEGDALDPTLGIPEHRYQLVVLAEVVASHFRDVQSLRALFERAVSWLAPGGLLVFSAFLADRAYQPDHLARQASQVFWCCLFTRGELETACRDLPLLLVSDESTYAFERNHLPKEAWPPTGWFATWARGGDLFELPASKPPHELRWLVYRKTASAPHYQGWVSTSVVRHVVAPVERVFAWATEPAFAARVFRAFLPVPGVAEVQPLTAATEGARARRRVRWSDGSVTIEEQLVERTPVRDYYRWDNTLKGPLGLIARVAEADWLFAATPTGTTIYWTYRFLPRSRLTRPLANILVNAFQRFMLRSVDSLRELAKG